MPLDQQSPLRIVYRHYGGDNAKPRPAYYSKMLALQSMLRAAEALSRPPEIVYVNDQVGPGPIRTLMETTGEVVDVRGGSDARSLREMLRREAARGAADDQFIWFSEDDYLYRPDALTVLEEGIEALPTAEYLTLYGSLALDRAASGRRAVRRTEPGAGNGQGAVVTSAGHWYRAMSSTSTFGTRLGTLRADLRLLRLAALSGGAWDHTTCLAVAGYLPFTGAQLRADLFPGRSTPLGDWPRAMARGSVRVAVTALALRRRPGSRPLYACDPEVIHHMEAGTDWRDRPSARTAATDWATIARGTEDWARARGTAGRPGAVA